MDLPSAPAASGGALNKCFCVSPGAAQQVTAAKLLTQKLIVRAQDGGNDVTVTAQDMSATKLADLSLESGGKVVLEWTFGCSDAVDGTGTLGTNAFADKEGGVKRFNDPLLQFATADAAGGITAAYKKMFSATISWGVTTEFVMAYGDTTSVNDLCAWMQVYAPPKVTLDFLYESDPLTLWDGANTARHIGIIQPGAAELDAAWAFVMPNSFIVDKPDGSYYGNNEHRVKVAYTGRPAGYDGTTSASQGNQPWYYLQADRSA
jgi:hypothetical protein